MEVVTSPPLGADVLLAARERIHTGPVPSWAVSTSFDPDFKAKQPDRATLLLLSKQIHAEHHQTCSRVVQRLENMQGVQELSQWRLPFEPLTMSVTVHWIKIRRGERELNQGLPDKFRLLQREEGLEGSIIDGQITLLLLLEDVRPGDLLDSCYTIERQPPFLAERCSCFLTLPAQKPVGKFFFSLRFKADRPMKWKSSGPNVKPVVERTENEMLLWSWSDKNYEPSRPEENIPEWFPDYPWLQISDCPDWGTVASAISTGWKKEIDDPAIVQLAKEIGDTTSDVLARIENAIRLIQDEYRYLSVNVDLAGQVPSPPGNVVRRRFGDCKDLGFLLVHLLERLGIPARPVLVDSILRKTVAGLLPDPNLFHHVVVEYQVQGQRHWVDATMKRQGGGARNPVITDFGVGLPVDPAASELIAPPQRPLQEDLYELRETVLLDTTGEPSLISVLLRAKGSYAESLRRRFEEKGVEEFARDRLEVCANRFFKATRSGPLQHRDDRAANEFVLVEVFEISGFLALDHDPEFCRFPFASKLLTRALVMPEHRSRRAPFALLHPCNLVHIVEIQSTGLQLVSLPRSRIVTPFVQFSRTQKSLTSYCSMTFSLSTLVDSVPSEHIAAHKKTVEQIWNESTWEIIAGLGYSRPRRRSDFGELPLPPRKARHFIARTVHPEYVRIQDDGNTDLGKLRVGPTTNREQALIASSEASSSKPAPSFRRGSQSADQARRDKRKRKGENLLWPIIISVIIISLIALFVFVSKPPTR